MAMKLYTGFSPNGTRVTAFLAEKEIDLPIEPVNVAAGETRTEAFLKINPLGQIPVLELDDGRILTETMAICRYLEELYPEPPLLGTTPVERAQIECLQRKMEFDGMIATSEAFRNDIKNENFAYRSLPGNNAIGAIEGLVERGHNSLKLFYHWLETYLKDSRFIAGDRFTMVDITAVCAVDFAKWVDLEIPKENTHSLRWYDEVSSRPSAQA